MLRTKKKRRRFDYGSDHYVCTCFGYCYCRVYLLHLSRQERSVEGKETIIDGIMGAIAVSIFVTVVAVVGFIYFTYQDKKEALKGKKQ